MTRFLYGLTLLIWIFWLLAYWRSGGLILRDIRHSLDTGYSRWDSAAIIAILVSNLVLITTGACFFSGIIGKAEPRFWVAATGTFLTLVGMAGTFYGRRALGRFWAADLVLQEDHQVENDGPYARVRHPIYTAALLMYPGSVLVFPAWWNGLTWIALLIAHLVKIREEERSLASQLAGYDAYLTRIRFRVVPGLW